MSGPRRIPHIQARLDEWARWRDSQGCGGGLGYGGSPIGYLMDLAAGKRVHEDTGGAGSFVPVDSIECSITDDAVLALPEELRRAVTAWHCAAHGTMDEVARRLGVVRGTLHRRLCHADIRVQQWLRDRHRTVQ